LDLPARISRRVAIMSELFIMGSSARRVGEVLPVGGVLTVW